MSLRNKLIRLAHAKPELRKHLLPLVADKTANIPAYYAVVSHKNKVIYFFGKAKNEKLARDAGNRVARILREIARDMKYINQDADKEKVLRNKYPKATDAVIEMALSSKYPLGQVSSFPNVSWAGTIESVRSYNPVFLSPKQMEIFKDFLKQ